jgi:NADPH-dependent curcumin reductase
MQQHAGGNHLRRATRWRRRYGFALERTYRPTEPSPIVPLAHQSPNSVDSALAVKEACPKGVDVFFDNTGGSIHDAVMRNVAIGARVVICGRIALAAQFGKPDIGERFMGQLIVSRASVHGFLVLDWWHRRDEALRRLAEWQLVGKIRFKEDILDGIERMPEAFLRLLHGKNFGKQIVRI